MKIDLLDGLNEQQRRAMLQVMVRRRFRKGDTLFHASDPGDTLHVLMRGYVAVRVGTRSGDVATLTVLGPGGFFGEQALLSDGHIRTASVVALEEVETMTLHRRDFEELRAADRGVDRILIDVLAGQVRRLSAQVTEALYSEADRRVLARLVDLAELYARGGAIAVDIPLTQDDLASMAGTTRPTANRVLQDLVAKGLVGLARGRITVLDRLALAKRLR